MTKDKAGNIVETDEIKPKCVTCDYSVSIKDSLDWSICQKGAPAAVWSETLHGYKGGWPMVRNTDYCGEHPHFPRTRAVVILEQQLLLLREIKEGLEGER